MKEIITFASNHFLLCSVWIIVFIALVFTFIQSKFSNIKNILHYEMISLINKNDAQVIDLRSRVDYNKGHIANSINLSEVDINNSNLGKINKYKNRTLIIVCGNGISAYRSAKKLNIAGFEHIYVLKDGLISWNKEHLPLVQNK